MNLLHVGLTCSSEEKADAFYADLLGLEKLAPKILPAEIAGAIFGIASELKVMNYISESTHFEIFIFSIHKNHPVQIEHICLEVEKLEEFLQKCRGVNAHIIQVPKGDSLVTFIRDFDGNLFEIKERS